MLMISIGLPASYNHPSVNPLTPLGVSNIIKPITSPEAQKQKFYMLLTIELPRPANFRRAIFLSYSVFYILWSIRTSYHSRLGKDYGSPCTLVTAPFAD